MIRWLPHVLLGVFLLVGCSQIKGIFTLRDDPEPSVSAPQASGAATQNSPATTQTSDSSNQQQNSAALSRVSDLEMQIDELNFQMKKQRAEVDYVKNQLDELQAKSAIWLNPLSVYDKEIILNNGTTLYGKIVAQDEQSIKVETLIGYLTLHRESIVRIVDNEAVQFQPSETHKQKAKTRAEAPPSAASGISPSPVSEITSGPRVKQPNEVESANCVLVGNIRERTDDSGNHIFSGAIKNTGDRRADFVKIHFQFRQNWSGDTKTMTAFVEGETYTYNSGVTSDATLAPAAMGKFELYVPKSFGNYIGYSYSIDWEEYE